MRTFSGKRSTLALAIAGVTAMSGFMAMPEARAEGFIDDSTLTGGIYYENILIYKVNIINASSKKDVFFMKAQHQPTMT